MPLVNIRLARRDLPTTAAQKAALIAGVTQLMQQVLDNPFLLLFIGITTPTVLYIIWGVMEIVNIPVAK